MSVCLRTKWFWVRVLLQSLNLFKVYKVFTSIIYKANGELESDLFQKANPGASEEEGTMSEFTIMVKIHSWAYKSFNKFQSKNTQIRQLWSFFFILNESLHFEKFESVDFKYYKNFFSNFGLKVPKQGIFGLNLKFFLHEFLQFPANWKVLISNMTIDFLKMQHKSTE